MYDRAVTGGGGCFGGDQEEIADDCLILIKLDGDVKYLCNYLCTYICCPTRGDRYGSQFRLYRDGDTRLATPRKELTQFASGINSVEKEGNNLNPNSPSKPKSKTLSKKKKCQYANQNKPKTRPSPKREHKYMHIKLSTPTTKPIPVRLCYTAHLGDTIDLSDMDRSPDIDDLFDDPFDMSIPVSKPDYDSDDLDDLCMDVAPENTSYHSEGVLCLFVYCCMLI